MVGENIYTDEKAIAAKMAEDVNAKLFELLPTEAAAAQAAANVEGFERDTINRYKERDYTDAARRLFYDSKKVELVLFSDCINDSETLIDYIQDPEAAIEKYALRYMREYAAKLYEAWIEYSGVSAAYEAITTDPEREEHRLLKISRSVTNEKSVRITLKNRNEVKVEADAVKTICYRGWISDLDVAAADRKKLNKNQYGRADDIHAADIVAIRHGGRVLYQAS